MSGKFQFESMGIGRLLKQSRLMVPPNQRPYAWEERHVRDLFQDLNEALTKDDEDYFLGTIVLIQSGRETSSIADGQQRLATATILLARIRDRLIRLSRQRRARSLDDMFLRNIDIDTEETLPGLSRTSRTTNTSPVLSARLRMTKATRNLTSLPQSGHRTRGCCGRRK
jgi:uncharacterized protein with ParB-like and HNH nuclease domain